MHLSSLLLLAPFASARYLHHRSNVSITRLEKADEPDLGKLCLTGQMNADSWRDNNMDYWLRYYSDLYPKNNESDITINGDETFPQYLGKVHGGLGNFLCDDKICNNVIDNVKQCQKNPRISFLLWGLLNFQSWSYHILDALDDEHESFQDKLPSMALNYTTHDTDWDTTGAKLAAAGSIMGFFGGFMGPVSEVTGPLAGGIGIASSLAGLAQNDAINIVQKEVEDTAKISEALGIANDAIRTTMNSIAEGVLTDIPDNSGDNLWSTTTTGAVNWLKDGAFAEAPTEVDYDGFNKQFDKIFQSAIIGSAYTMEQVFIVKVTESIDGKDPCTVDLDDMNKARICLDDVAYIFLRTDDMVNFKKGSWPNPPGIGNLNQEVLKALENSVSAVLPVDFTEAFPDLGIDLEDIVKSSVWYQDKLGGYGKQISMDDMESYISGQQEGPPNNVWMNLPVLRYEDTPAVSDNAWNYVGDYLWPKSHLLNNCAHWISKQDDWPYDDMKYP